MAFKHLVVLFGIFLLAALAVCGCSGPTPTAPPQPAVGTPQEAVTGYWQAIDRGDYDAAYDHAYPVQNVSKQQWIDEHRSMWGEGGGNIRIYNFTVIEVVPLSPDTVPGNFTGVDSVLVNTSVSYYGKNTTGLSQFAAVKTADDQWKFYGSY